MEDLRKAVNASCISFEMGEDRVGRDRFNLQASNVSEKNLGCAEMIRAAGKATSRSVLERVFLVRTLNILCPLYSLFALPPSMATGHGESVLFQATGEKSLHHFPHFA